MMAHTLRTLRNACAVALLFCVPCFISFLHAQEDVDINQLKASAAAGDADAQYALGSAYQKGEGVEQSETEGVHWITKAANQGQVDAQFNLAIAYRGGFGVHQDNKTAYMWLEMAARHGSDNAIQMRRDLADRMTEEQIEEAKDMATHWKPPE